MENMLNENINNELENNLSEAAEQVNEELTAATEQETEQVASEEVLEVALLDEETDTTEDYALADYTESEISGLTDAQRKRRDMIDKITTGILIFLLASPVFIILYIFLWFIFKT